MSDVLSFNPNRALTANIDAAAAARAFFYDAGTTTLRTVYADSALTTPHASPLVANAAGIFPAVYVDGAAVKVVAQDAAGATLYTLDPCVKVAATGATAAQVSFAPSTAAPYANVQDAIDDLAVFRNGGDSDRIINGDFGVWQRGPSFGTGSHTGYTADRWRLDRVGGFASVERINETIGTTLGSSNPQYFVRAGVASQSLPSHVAFFEQLVEGVRSYAGQTITVLGWARRGSGAGNIASQVVQSFGTGGASPSDPVGATPTTVALTGSWQPFAATFAVPSIAGKTLGSDGNDNFVVRFYLSAGADFNGQANSLGLQTISVDMWGIHIRLGTWTAADAELYRPRNAGAELALCQRYYETGAVRLSAYATNTSGFNYSHQFKATKRAVPAVAFSSPTYSSASTLTAFTVSTNDFSPQATATATGAVSFAAGFTANAEL